MGSVGFLKNPVGFLGLFVLYIPDASCHPFCIFLMLVISFYGEKQYQQHCEELGLKCEKGQIHQLKDSFVTWANKKFQDIKKNNTFE